MKSTKPDIKMTIVADARYGYHFITVYFTPYIAGSDMSDNTNKIHEGDMGKFHGVDDIRIEASISDICSYTYGHETCFIDKNKPTAGYMRKVLPLMEKVDIAIRVYQEVAHKYDFVTTIAALVDYFSVKVLAIAEYNKPSRVFRGSYNMVNAAGCYEAELIGKYGAKKEAV